MHHAHRALIRVRVHEYGVHHTVHGCLCADPDGKGCDGCQCKAWQPQRLPASKFKIRQQVCEQRLLPDLPAALLKKSRVAEIAASGKGRFFSRHPLFHQVFDLLLQMLANRDGKIFIAAAARKELPEGKHHVP